MRKLVQSEVFTPLPSGQVPQEPWGYKRGKAAEQVGVVGPQPHLAYSSSTFILFDILRFQVRFSLTGGCTVKVSRNTVNNSTVHVKRVGLHGHYV